MLLRGDEVVKITTAHVTFKKFQTNRLVIYLAFRKTHQDGNIPPFILRRDIANPIMCPIRAFLRWIYAGRFSATDTVPLFCSIDGLNRINYERPLTYSVLKNDFMEDLKACGINTYSMYGTHSFRRGGAQYFHIYKGWDLATISKWGGWSTNFDNTVIMRYLVSEKDGLPVPRDKLFKLDNGKALARYR